MTTPKHNILLTGFMGAGKSRVARELSRLTGLFAVDTDDLVESLAQRRIAEIFAQQGEAAFRAMEQQTADWLRASVDHTLVATGGGFFQVRGFMDLGRVFFLEASFDTILARLGSDSGDGRAARPLFQDVEAARRRFAERLPLYLEKAHHIVNTEGRSCVEVAREIAALLERDAAAGYAFLPCSPCA